MAISKMNRRIAVAVAVVVLCATLSGCISDMTTSSAHNTGDAHLRYYGGPKSPMWPAPAAN
jgi:predicted small secreted protein